MTQAEMLDFATKLYDCSIYMKEFNTEVSDLLLEMSSEVIFKLRMSVIPEDVAKDVNDIKAELLNER
jgi:hypothetical protein